MYGTISVGGRSHSLKRLTGWSRPQWQVYKGTHQVTILDNCGWTISGHLLNVGQTVLKYLLPTCNRRIERLPDHIHNKTRPPLSAIALPRYRSQK